MIKGGGYMLCDISDISDISDIKLMTMKIEWRILLCVTTNQQLIMLRSMS